MAQRRSRKRQGRRRPAPAPVDESAARASGLERGYARARRRDEEARAALEPLAPGERPPAVTAGALAAAALALANLVALVTRYDADEPRSTLGSALATLVLFVTAAGMWRAKYWAVLGMQALLALTIVIGSLALVRATSVAAALLLVAIVGSAGTLFWFLVKAMARIQMPARPGAREGA